MGSTREVISNHRRKLSILLLVVILTAGIAGVYSYMGYLKTHISTDDAYVAGNVYTIAAKIPGTVKEVFVHDNQFVKKGSLLLEIDAQDYDVRLKEAESARDAEKSKLVELALKKEVAIKQLAEIRSRVASARANLNLQEVGFEQANRDLTRAQQLRNKEILPEEKLEKAKTDHDMAAARVVAAREQLRQDEASIETQESIIRQAESSMQSQQPMVGQKEEVRKEEALKKGYTRIFAPADGYVTKKSVEKGNQIQAGQPLMAVVPLQDVWIVANYKETQIERVRPGQKVRIKADTYPGRIFEGQVESIMAGTGAVFSLFPPENATGNYVKVVQRIPVKIVLDKNTDPAGVLRVGMSVQPTIITGP